MGTVILNKFDGMAVNQKKMCAKRVRQSLPTRTSNQTENVHKSGSLQGSVAGSSLRLPDGSQVHLSDEFCERIVDHFFAAGDLGELAVQRPFCTDKDGPLA